MQSIYEKHEEKIVRMGRNLIITLAEKNEIYPKDDLLWNAGDWGNKLVSLGTTWSNFKSFFEDLNDNETKVVYNYLDKYGLEHPSIPIEDLF